MRYHPKKHFLLLAAVVLLLAGCSKTGPISLHPENPHYFLWKGKPAILAGSTEHYGAVLNLDFDYPVYLNTIQKDGLNLTRTFTGIYCEHPEAFNIAENTLAPKPGRLICPWARSDEPGYANGGKKFDLTLWDEAYFARMKDFIRQAAARNVVVELVLFCTYYGDAQWNLSPLNIRNNINGIGDAERTEILTLQHPDLTKVQDQMVRKLVTELNDFDNLYYEICNEPYFAGPTLQWQAHVSALIRRIEADLPKQHLIAQNIQNNSARIENPDPNVDVFNFHYAVSEAVDWNTHLNKALGDDETGFEGTSDEPYRLEGWNFLVSGGALFDHLDYSFTTEHENGTFEFPGTQPGGGGISLRRQFSIMKSFIERFDFIRMTPDFQTLTGGVPEDIHARVLSNPGKDYAAYFMRQQVLDVNFSLRWTGRIQAVQAGTYTFYTVTDDGVRLWIDGKLLIDDWTSHAPVENAGQIDLQRGQKADIRMEYFQGKGGASLQLLWSGPDLPKQAIPNDRFSLPGDNAPGLKLDWFEGTELKDFKAGAVVFGPDFDGALSGIFPHSKKSEIFRPVFNLPKGKYRIEWLDTVSGEIIRTQNIVHAGGECVPKAPDFDVDVALSVRSK